MRRLYVLLQHLLLPPDFRREFGDEMTRAATERAARGGPGASSIWLGETVDLVRTGAREWGALAAEVAGVGTRHETGEDGTMGAVGRDIRFAVRTLARAPLFAVVVVGTLALGIGANTAIFSVVDAVLLEPLPYEEADRLVTVWQDVTARGGPDREWFSHEDFLDVAAEPNLMEAAAVWGGWQPTLTGVESPTVMNGATVSHAMLSGVLGVEPALGRGFTPADDVEGAPGVVLLSHAAWQEFFGGDPGVVGRTLSLSESPFTVVGVMPPGFETPFLPQTQLWRPLGTSPAFRCTRGCFGWRVVARLAPGVSLDQARARARALAARLEAAHPDTNTRMSFTVVDLRDDMTQASARGLWVLLGAVGFVLLIACTNVANLILARGATRRGELSVRAALGAGRGAILRQLLAESFVLAVAGGVAGLALAWWGTGALLRMAPEGVVPRLDGVGIDAGVLAFTVGVTVLTGFLFGLAPSWRASRPDVHGAIRASGRGGGGEGRVRKGLAAVQVALAVILLVGSGLMLKSFQHLHDAPLGFEPENVLTLQLSLPAGRYQEQDAVRDFYFRLLDRLEAIPGVERAGAVNSLPLAGFDGDADFMVEGEPPPDPGVSQAAWIRPVTDGYFETVGLELAEGRAFTPGDDAEAPRVIIVNETLAQRYYGGDAVGRRLAFGSDPSTATWRTIVGVAPDLRHFGLREDARPAVYLPYGQVPFAAMAVAVKTRGAPLAVAGDVRAAIASLDPALAASAIQPLQELVDAALAPDRFLAVLLGLFALTALLLAAVGIYGVISYGVTRRFREMGIRMALGAEAGQLRRLVVREGLTLVAGGAVVGLAGAAALTGVLGSLLYGVEATDPATFALTTALLAGVAFLASWIPAWRASRADPARVLRQE